ncbi:cytochrome P450 [Penicillium verhagenii]|uniref:cytochrome P450 n=1 Tax=Penicillium verhagenii TaxID=1562060 RepID=UPI0025450E2B|nr:cytochrome P450 [Penicillium verhagenii]KAJ5915610.1 cytochrome P450 [Penicillium verhagenii]
MYYLRLFWSRHPVQAKIVGQEVYIVQGPENIQPLLRQRAVSPFIAHAAFLHHVFGLPSSAAKLYLEDNSGESAVPDSDSRVADKNRVNHLTRNAFNRLLSGPGLAPLSKKFESNLTARILNANIGRQWTKWDDFMDFFQTDVTSAILDSMSGPFLLKNHPGFTKDLWAVDHEVTSLMFLPRLFASRVTVARNNGLASIRSWHSWARANFDSSSIDAEGDDPYWGTKFFREMNSIFSAMDGFDEGAIASEIFAFLWGANTNTVISTFWASLEVSKDPELLEQVRSEAQACIISQTESSLRFDIDRLLQQPVMQAVFSETLRLRINGLMVRYPSKGDLVIKDWVLPKNKFIISSMTPGHMDPDVWCSGSAESHPVEEFWPGRFLQSSEQGKLFTFSMDRAKGHWMPFGGGHFPCPGRHLAKLTSILTMALLTTLYDCEPLVGEKDMKMSSRNFGFGALGPAGKIPVRIRRRGAEV